MTCTSGLLARVCQLRGNTVPANRLAQAFAGRQRSTGRQLIARDPALQRLDLDYRL
jgi:hypothetical protein